MRLLRRLLPGEADTEVVRACILGEAPDDRGLEWLGAHWEAYFRTGRVAARPLLPLLWDALRVRAGDLPGRLQTYLRAATAQEALRYARIETILLRALDALDATGCRPALSGGLALAARVYPRPDLRHCHDIDLVLARDRWPVAAAALVPVGFHPLHGTRERMDLGHESGLPLTLHRHFVPSPFASADAAGLAEATMGERMVRCPLPEVQLVRCGVAAFFGRPTASLQPLVDAGTLLRRTPALDWAGVLRLVQGRAVAWPLEAVLSYLAVAVGVSPPAGVLDALCAGARGVAPREAWPFWRALLRRGARAARARATSRGARSA